MISIPEFFKNYTPPSFLSLHLLICTLGSMSQVHLP